MTYNPWNHTAAVMRTGLVCCLVWLTTLSFAMADETEQLQIEVEALERQLLELTEPQLGLPAEEIRKQIKSVFQAKQRLAETQLRMLADRVKYMETEIRRRSENEEQIVERRLAEVLDRREARKRERQRVQSGEQAGGEQPASGNPEERHLDSDAESAWRSRSEQLRRSMEADHRETVNKRLAAEADGAGGADASELTFEVYRLKYVGASQAYEVLSNFLSDKNYAGVRMAHDVPTNSILLQGNTATHALARKLLEKLDQPPLKADTSPATKPNEKESTDHREIRYLVSIPSREEWRAELVEKKKSLNELENRLAELREQVGLGHPSTITVSDRRDRLTEQLKNLELDIVTYNIFMNPKTRELAQDILQAELGENGLAREVKATFAPQGHLQLRGPRLSVEALGDKIVKLLNQSADSRHESIQKSIDIYKQADREMAKTMPPNEFNEVQMKLRQQIAELERQLHEEKKADSTHVEDEKDSSGAGRRGKRDN